MERKYYITFAKSKRKTKREITESEVKILSSFSNNRREKSSNLFDINFQIILLDISHL